MNTLSILFEVAKPLFPEADEARIETLLNGKQHMLFSWKTNDDPERPSKRFQPIQIELNECFATSELAKRPLAVTTEEFAAFVRNKRAQFQPRTTNDTNESRTKDIWVFPPQC